MKCVLVILVALMSSISAYAGIQDLSWPEIEQKYFIFTDGPGAQFLNSNPRALGSHYIRFMSTTGKPQTCITGNTIYAGRIQSCVKVGSNRKEKCLKKEANDLWIPISGTREECLKYAGREESGQCLQSRTVEFKVKTNVKIKIYDSSRSLSHPTLLGTKMFQIPNCEN